MGHPDAFIAMKNHTHEVRSHFAAPPYDYYELREVPGARRLLDSAELIGGPLTQGQFFTTTRFAEANPKLIEAVRAAAEEAKSFIGRNMAEAIEAYREVNNDKTSADVLADILEQPGMQDWNLYPQGTMKFAAHLHKVGTLKTAPPRGRTTTFQRHTVFPGADQAVHARHRSCEHAPSTSSVRGSSSTGSIAPRGSRAKPSSVMPGIINSVQLAHLR
jgi:ABC-type nitrate/sulfonate/bicarbonate transport system substrate-binding protein